MDTFKKHKRYRVRILYCSPKNYKNQRMGSRIATLTMAFKLILSAQKRWSRLKSHIKIKQVWDGIKFKNGSMIKEDGKLEEVVA